MRNPFKRKKKARPIRWNTLVLCGTYQSARREFGEMLDKITVDDTLQVYKQQMIIEYIRYMRGREVVYKWEFVTPDMYRRFVGGVAHDYWSVGPYDVDGWARAEVRIRHIMLSTRAMEKHHDKL